MRQALGSKSRFQPMHPSLTVGRASSFISRARPTKVEAVTGSRPRRDGIDVQAGAASLRITALRDDILRVRIAPGSAFPEDASWAALSQPRNKSVDVQPI